MGGLNQVGRSQKDQEVIPRGVDKVKREKDKPRRTTSRTKSALRTKRDIAFLKELHKNRIGYGLARTRKLTRSGELDMAQQPSAHARQKKYSER